MVRTWSGLGPDVVQTGSRLGPDVVRTGSRRGPDWVRTWSGLGPDVVQTGSRLGPDWVQTCRETPLWGGLSDLWLFPPPQLLKDVTPKRRSRRQLAQLDQRSPYVTACFKQLPSSFTVGSEHSYSNCENKPLEPGQEYVFFLLAELSSTTGVSPTPSGPTRASVLLDQDSRCPFLACVSSCPHRECLPPAPTPTR